MPRSQPLRTLLIQRLFVWLGLWALLCASLVFLMGRMDVKSEYQAALGMVDSLYSEMAEQTEPPLPTLGALREQLAQGKAQREKRETRRELLLTTSMLILMAMGSALVVLLTLRPALSRPLRNMVHSLRAYEDAPRQPKNRPQAQHFQIDELQSIHNTVLNLIHTLEAEQQKSSELLQRVVDLREKEREAIAQDLHDYFGQSLTAMSVNTAFLAKNTTGPLQEAASSAHDQAQEMLAWLRGSLRELKPHLLLEVSLRDAAFDLLDNAAKRHGWFVDFAWEGEQHALPDGAPIAIYRSLQEALTNIARHAPKAKHVKVLAGLDPSRQQFMFIIENDGLSPVVGSKPKASLGLTGISERMSALGGNLRWSSEDGHFTLIGQLPSHTAHPTEGHHDA